MASKYEVNDVNGLKDVLSKIMYPVPEGLKNVPFTDKLDILINKSLLDYPNATGDLVKEKYIAELTLKGVREGLSKLKYLNIRFSRPDDYYVEMLKTDEQMKRILHKLESTK